MLGVDPATNLPVTLRKGPYGFYVQRGEASGKGETAVKPKRQSLPRGLSPTSVDLQRALALLSLPREVGRHPETGEMIAAAVGRFGPYLKYQGNFISLKGDDDVLSIGLNRAVTLIAESPKKAPAQTLGTHPDDGKPITMRQGRFGRYVQHGSIRATLPKGKSADTLTLDEAVALLAAKAAKGGGNAARKSAGKKVAGKKSVPGHRGAARTAAGASAAQPAKKAVAAPAD
jgi:DNA topoisomerase-1